MNTPWYSWLLNNLNKKGRPFYKLHTRYIEHVPAVVIMVNNLLHCEIITRTNHIDHNSKKSIITNYLYYKLKLKKIV